jgi:hypothetical protein
MALDSKILVPELQYYFNKFVRNSLLNKSEIPSPVSLPDSYFTENRSFIRLLFDNDWPKVYTYYRYLYKENTVRSSWPSEIQTRILLYPATAKYYTMDDSTSSCIINVFSLDSTSDISDITLLDRLLKYRTSDSTSNIVITDIDYNSLTTSLSKLIYLFLDLKLNQNVTLYDNGSLLSSPLSILESCYEVYLIENMFIYISISNQDILGPISF